MDINTQERLITLKEAATIAQRSISTIRTWIRAGKLQDMRQAGDRVSPVMVSHSELLVLCSKQRQMRSGAPISNTQPELIANNTALVETLKAQIDDLKRDKAELRSELSFVRKDLESARERIAALEREMNGGVRGLIRSAIFGKK